MFFFLTRKLAKNFTRKAHRYLKAEFSPFKIGKFELFLLRRERFTPHHYRLNARKIAMV